MRTPITWVKDPTRHLLKIKAVNAKDSDDADPKPSQPDELAQDKSSNQLRAD